VQLGIADELGVSSVTGSILGSSTRAALVLLSALVDSRRRLRGKWIPAHEERPRSRIGRGQRGGAFGLTPAAPAPFAPLPTSEHAAQAR
jgi:hypothetical protein